jgi:hypothetical protein
MNTSIMRSLLAGLGVITLGVFSAFGYAPNDRQDADRGAKSDGSQDNIILACGGFFEPRCITGPGPVTGVRG